MKNKSVINASHDPEVTGSSNARRIRELNGWVWTFESHDGGAAFQCTQESLLHSPPLRPKTRQLHHKIKSGLWRFGA